MRGRVRWLVVLVGALLLLLATLPSIAVAASPPSELETEPVEFTSTGVKLKGTLNPEGSPTYYRFAYIQAGALECLDMEGGLIENCWGRTPLEGPLTGSGSQEVSAEVSGLAPGVYRYRLVAENEGGTRTSPVGSFAVPPPEGKSPAIESVSVSHLTSTDATLEATVDTEGQATLYEFKLWSACGLQGLACEWIRVFPLPSGLLLPSYRSQSVSIDLNSVGVKLCSGTVYGYSIRVLGTDTEGAVEAPQQTFEAPGEPVAEPPSIVTPAPASRGPAASSSGGQGTRTGSTATTSGAASGAAGTALRLGVLASGTDKHGRHHRPKHRGTEARGTEAAKHSKHAKKGKHHK